MEVIVDFLLIGIGALISFGFCSLYLTIIRFLKMFCECTEFEAHVTTLATTLVMVFFPAMFAQLISTLIS